MKTPDQPGEGWALPDPGLATSPKVPPLTADLSRAPTPYPHRTRRPPFARAAHERSGGEPLVSPPHGRRPWIVRAAPGTPFHRLARTPVHRWWRPLAGTLFAVALGLVVLLSVSTGAMTIAIIAGENLVDMGADQIFEDPAANLGVHCTSRILHRLYTAPVI